MVSATESARTTSASENYGPPWSTHFLRAFAWSFAALVLYSISVAINRPLYETQEARIGVVAREMIERQNFLEPTLANVQRLNKPPLPYWLTVLTARMISSDAVPNERTLTCAVLIPQAVCGALAVFVVMFFGSIAFGPSGGTFAGLILGFSMMPARFAQLGYPDTALMLGCAGTICAAAWIACSPRPGFFSAVFLGVSMAWAMMIKEPILALVLPAPLAVEMFFGLKNKRYNVRKVILFAIGFVIAAALVAPWFYLVAQNIPHGWDTLVAERQYIWVKGHAHKNFFYYFHKLAAGMLPWTPLMLLAFFLRRKGPELAATPNALPAPQAQLAQRIFRFVSCVAVLGFCGFLSRAKQQEYYLLPIVPAIALAAGYAIGCCRTVRGNLEEGLAWFHIALGVVGAAGLCYIPVRDPDGANKYLCFALAIPFLIFCVGAAHYWAARRLTHAASMTGVAFFILFIPLAPLTRAKGLRTLAIKGTDIQNKGSLEIEAPRLRTELDALSTPGSEVKLYAWGNSFPMMNFLLARPVLTQKDLFDAIKTPSEVPPRRVAIVSPEILKQSGLEKYLPPGKNPPIIALVLPPDAELATTLKKRRPDKRERTANEGDDEDDK